MSQKKPDKLEKDIKDFFKQTGEENNNYPKLDTGISKYFSKSPFETPSNMFPNDILGITPGVIGTGWSPSPLTDLKYKGLLTPTFIKKEGNNAMTMEQETVNGNFFQPQDNITGKRRKHDNSNDSFLLPNKKRKLTKDSFKNVNQNQNSFVNLQLNQDQNNMNTKIGDNRNLVLPAVNSFDGISGMNQISMNGYGGMNNDYFKPQPPNPVQKVPNVQMYFPTQMNSPIQPSKIMSLIQGFTKPPVQGETYPGGKDNSKLTLPMQIIQLHPEVLPVQSEIRNLSCKVYIIGHDKNGDKKELGEMSERRFLYKKDAISNPKWVCEFDSLICKFSSHSNGGKLCLRFVLLNNMKNRICHVDSNNFLTITKRGYAKKQERQRRKKEKINADAKILSCTPSTGFTQGGLLVKIAGKGFSNVNRLNVKIKFGAVFVKVIHAIKDNLIICETPVSTPGSFPVMISLDGVTFLKSDAVFEFVSPTDQLGIGRIITQMSEK